MEGESKYNPAGGGRLDSVVYVRLVAEGNARILVYTVRDF